MRTPLFTTLLLAALAAPMAVCHAQYLETNIAMPPQTSARDLVYNPLENKVYTANVADQGMPPMRSVTIIDGATKTIITT